LLQVAYGQSSSSGPLSSFVTTYLTQAFSGLSNSIYSAQTLANSTIQQFYGNYSAVTQSITNAIQTVTTTAQQQAATLIASYPQAQEQTQACLNQLNQILSAISSSASK